MSKIKRVLTAALAAVMAVSCLSLSSFAGNLNDESPLEKPETAAGTAAYATGKIVVDGAKDALYDTATPMEIAHVAENNDNALFNKDFKGKTWALWDEEYLYFYTEVSDVNIVNTYAGSNSETKLNDRITYYMDFNNTQTVASKYTENVYSMGLYFDVRVTDDEDYNFYIADGVSKFAYPTYNDDKESEAYAAYKEFVDKTFDRATVVTPGVGYSFEVKIKVSNLEYTVFGKTVKQDNTSGAKYGFDVYLHDRNEEKTDGRVALVTFSEKSDNMSWDFPGYLGTLTLGAKPVTAAKHGWVQEGGNWRYYNHGALLKNVFVDKQGTTVFVKANGNMAKKEIVTYKGKQYYITATGAVKKSSGYAKVTVGKKSYIVNKSGVVQKNKSLKVGKKRYVVNKYGVVQTGNKIVTVGKAKYYVDKKGVAAVKAIKTVKKAKYYFDANGKMAKKKLVTVKGKKYYFGANGKMVKNKTVKVKKATYKANAKGVCKKVK